MTTNIKARKKEIRKSHEVFRYLRKSRETNFSVWFSHWLELFNKLFSEFTIKPYLINNSCTWLYVNSTKCIAVIESVHTAEKREFLSHLKIFRQIKSLVKLTITFTKILSRQKSVRASSLVFKIEKFSLWKKIVKSTI